MLHQTHRLKDVASLTFVLLFLLLLRPAETRADGEIPIVGGDLPFISDNIQLLGTIPLKGAIGATFRNNQMYVTGIEGLSTFDISDPTLPLLTSFTPLPHFENEDVSIGGNLLLIANDGSTTAGILYVFDISEPAMPRLLSALPTGGDPLLNTTPSHTVTCLPGCRYAYLAGTSQGIAIVDLTIPALPRLAGTFQPPITGWATHDVEIDGQGLAWIVGAQGTAAYDVRNPLAPVLVAQTDAAATSGPLNDFIHHNAARPERVLPSGKRVPGKVILLTEEDYARPTCEGAGSFQTWQIQGELSALTPAQLTNLDSWSTELEELTRLEGKSPATILCSAHYFDERGGLVAQGWYEQGTRILDVRNPADIKQVGYFVMPVTETWAAYWAPTDPAGEIVYSVDLARGIDILHIERPAPESPAKRAPVRKHWLNESGMTVAPTSAFSLPGSTFTWACRIPKVPTQ